MACMVMAGEALSVRVPNKERVFRFSVSHFAPSFVNIVPCAMVLDLFYQLHLGAF